jgi:hypothetical protein
MLTDGVPRLVVGLKCQAVEPLDRLAQVDEQSSSRVFSRQGGVIAAVSMNRIARLFR